MTISFMILDRNATFSEKLKEVVEHKLTELTGIEAQIITATSLSEAMDKKDLADIHLVELDLMEKGNGLDYINEISKGYSEDEPTIPVIVVSSYSEEFYKMRALNDLKVVGYIEKDTYSEEQLLKDLRRAVKCFKGFNNRTVTFSRPGYKATYAEKNIWCINRLPHGQKKIVVTVYDELNGDLFEEEFSIKSSLTEIPGMFSSPDKIIRCHQSWLINPSVILGETKKHLVLLSGKVIPLGGEYKDNVESHYITSRGIQI